MPVLRKKDSLVSWVSMLLGANRLRKEHAFKLQCLWESWPPLSRRLNCQPSLKVQCLPGGPPWWSLLQYPPIFPQVTLSYGVFEGKLNIIKLPGPFSHEEDPSR